MTQNLQLRSLYCGFEFNVLPCNCATVTGLIDDPDCLDARTTKRAAYQSLSRCSNSDTMLHERLQAYAPGIELGPGYRRHVKIAKQISSYSHPPVSAIWSKPLELVIAECEDSGGEITADDVRKLTKVAEALEEISL